MESWVLEGDSYSFLRSAPHTFNLQNRDRPNRVEIFDITRIPSQRNIISETTCLCDIFGDDCETHSLSCSPASTSILKREPHEVKPVDDTNHSSGSYHTANSSERSSDASDTFEDSKEAIPCTLKTHLNSSGSATASSDGLDTSKPLQKADYLESHSGPASTGASPETQGVNSFFLTEGFPNNGPSRGGGLLTEHDIVPPSPELRGKASSPELKYRSSTKGKTHSGGVISPIDTSQSGRPDTSSIESAIQPTAAYTSETKDDFSIQDEFGDLVSPLDRRNICPIPVFSIIPESRDSPLFFSEKRNITDSLQLKDISPIPVFPIIPNLLANPIASFHDPGDKAFVTEDRSQSPTRPTDKLLEGTTDTVSLSGHQKTSSSSEALTAIFVSEQNLTAKASEEGFEVTHIKIIHTIPSNEISGTVSVSPVITNSPVPTEAASSPSPEHVLITYSPEPIDVASSLKQKAVTGSPEAEELPYSSTPEPTVLTYSPEAEELPYPSTPEPTVLTYSPEAEELPYPSTPELSVLTYSPEAEELPYPSTPEPSVLTNSPEPTISPNFYSLEPSEVTSSGIVPEPTGITSTKPELPTNLTSPEHTEIINSPEPELAANLISTEYTEIVNSPKLELATNFTSPEHTEIVHSLEPEIVPNLTSPEHIEIVNSLELELATNFTSSEHTKIVHSLELELVPNLISPERTEIVNSPEPELAANLISTEYTEVVNSPKLELATNFTSPAPTIISESPEPEIVVYCSSPEPTKFSSSLDCAVIVSSPEPTHLFDLFDKFVANSPEPKGTANSFESTERAISTEPIWIATSPELEAYSPEHLVIPNSPEHLVIPNSLEHLVIRNSSEHSGNPNSPEHIAVAITPEPILIATSTKTTAISSVSSTPDPTEIIQSPEHTIIAISPEFILKSLTPMYNPTCPSPEIQITYSAEPRATPDPSENVRISYSPQTTDMSSSPHFGHGASPLDSRRMTLTPEVSITTQANRGNLSPDHTNRTPSPFRSPTSPQIAGLTYSVASSDGRFSELKDICSSPELSNVTPEPEQSVSECSLELWSPSSPSAGKHTASCPELQNRTLSPYSAATNDSPLRSYSPGQRVQSSSPGQRVKSISPGQRVKSSSPEKRYVGVSPVHFATSPKSEGCHLSPTIAKSGASPSSEIISKGQQESALSKSKSTAPLFEPDSKDELQEPDMCGLVGYSYISASPTHQCSQINQPTSPSPKSLSKYPTIRPGDTDKITETKSKLIDCENPLNPVAWSHSEIASKVEQHRSWEENERWSSETFERQSVGTSVRAGHMGLTCRESPTVRHGDGSGEYDRRPCQGGEEYRAREGEERKASVKGEGRSRTAGYRGEQVELSFSARNRKGPASSSAAPTSRDPKLGIPARSYSEWLLATRQQQSQIRAQSLQQENKGGARRLKAVPGSNNTGVGRLSPDHTARETTSMGSEFDEADSEVKWLTDVAFRSLSSPQVDYLDVYNSSHRSSTNASQPSTQGSPGATAWLSYADFRGSSQGEGDDVPRQPYVPPLDGLDPSRRFELGSFECVDVALESREEARKGKRTVPKRQIQLKRRDNNEPNTKENIECALGSPSTERRFNDTLARQHRTPVKMEEEMTTDSPEADQTGRKPRMQKSSSLDETSCKSKVASCLIKNVLSKKMRKGESSQTTHRKADLSPSDDPNDAFESITPPPEREHSKLDNVKSSQLSDNNMPPMNPPVKEEQSPRQGAKHQRGLAPKVPPKPLHYILPPLPQDISMRPEPQHKNKVRKESPLGVPLEGKKMEKQDSGNGGKQAAYRNPGDKHSRDSANVSVGNTGTTATRALGMPSGMINREQECHARPENHKQHSGRSVFMSKTPEIMLKPCVPKERKQSSVKVSLSPGLERKAADSQERALEEKQEEPELEVETEQTEDECDTNKIKKPIHKVRDVRRLVKNTYNLSFKAATHAVSPNASVSQKQEETVPMKPVPMQIECRAINRKDNKQPSQQNDMPVDTSKTDLQQESTEINEQTGSPQIPPKTTQANTLTSDLPHKEPVATPGMDTNTVLDASGQMEKVSNEAGRHPKLDSLPKIPSKDREVSKLLFQPDGSSKGIPNPDAPPSPRLPVPSSSHSVSMIRKEKGMQADIGVCDIVSEGASNPRKHVNRIEVPLQTSCMDGSAGETHRTEGDTAQHSTASSPRLPSPEKIMHKHRSSPKPQGQEKTVPKVIFEGNYKQSSPSREAQELPDLGVPQVINIRKETASPVVTGKSQPVTEVKPVCGEGNAPASQKTSKEIELPIQVRSISYDRPKPVLPTKPSCKQPLIEIKSVSNDKTKADNPQPAMNKHQSTEERKFEAAAPGEPGTKPAPPVHTNKLAVSARSSYRPPPNKMAAVSSLTQQTAVVESLNNKQLHAVTTSQANTIQMPTVFTSKVQGQPIILDKSSNPGETQGMPASSSGSIQTVGPIKAQAPSYTQQRAVKSADNQVQTEDLHFYASDDPPSYDDRESFSPYLLSDLPLKRSNRYHPNSRPPPCSCSSSCSSHPGHPRLSPHTRTPPITPHSPGQSLPYPGAPPQAQVRPHQCRPDGPPLSYKPGSPKAPMLNPTAPPAMFQPVHHPSACPGPLLQPCGDERQHVDRRPAHHPPQQQHASGASGGPYSDHLHPSNMPPMESRPQYLCSPQDLGSSYGSEYGPDGPGGGSVMYPDSAGGLGYGQGPRRVLLDPDTGKYFYIEVPMQPLRKMLFDPETGQYVEVLIPQQALSHSSLYSPPAAPYSSMHGPSMYAPQYLPYSVPTHPQATHPPRNAEPPVPTTLHQNSIGYGPPGGQVPKSELQTQNQNHPPLDQGYLESMYYIPTGMNASPNPTPSDCYHKPSNLPSLGSRRS